VYAASFRDFPSSQVVAPSSDRVDFWPTLLIVDSDPEMLRTLTCLLEKRGFHVAAASTLAEAKTFYQRRAQWTMVIADYHLPDGDSGELCHWLRSQSATAAVPVLLMSGSAHAAALAPELDVLAKPFRIDELEDRMRTLLRVPQN
jgi:DNA-binding response OmpR family regulator